MVDVVRTSGVVGGAVDAAVGVADAGVVAVEALDAEDVAEVGVLLAEGRLAAEPVRSGWYGWSTGAATDLEAAGELGAVGGGAGGVAVERNGVADAVAAAAGIVFAGMGGR